MELSQKHTTLTFFLHGNYIPPITTMKLSQEKKKNPEPIFKFIDHAHPGINECPFAG